MMFKKFAVIGMTAILALSGCTTPPADSEIQERKARYDNSLSFAESKLKPLVPICLSAFETGKLPTDQVLARRGYSPDTGFTLWRGANYKTSGVKRSAADFIAFHPVKCHFGLYAVTYRNVAYEAIGNVMKENGYQFSRASGPRIFYKKSNIEVIVASHTDHGRTTVFLIKK